MPLITVGSHCCRAGQLDYPRGYLVQAVDVRLGWNASPSPQVTGYELYYGTVSGYYSESVDTGAATTASLSGLQAGQTYYFAALAYDAAGDQSPFSNEVKYAVPAGDDHPADGHYYRAWRRRLGATELHGHYQCHGHGYWRRDQRYVLRQRESCLFRWYEPLHLCLESAQEGRTHLLAASHGGGCPWQCGLIEPHHRDGAVGDLSHICHGCTYQMTLRY